MRKRTPAGVCRLLACVIVLGLKPAAAVVPERRPLAFVGVNVVSMTRDGLSKDQTVVVEGGRITRVGPSASVRPPRNARRIDGRGKYLMPGLVDFHVHLRDESELLSYLIHGVTTVVHMGGPTGNVPDVLALRRRVAGGEVTGPNVYTTGRILDGDPAVFPGVSTVVNTPAEARRAVEDQYRAGVDFIKVYNNLTSDVLRATVEAAHRRGLAVVGHVPRRDGRPRALQTALAAGQDMIAHGEEFFFTYFYGDADGLLNRGLPPQPERSGIPTAVRLARESGAAVTPNLSFVAMTRRQLDDLDAVLSDPEARHLHPAVLAMWRGQNPTRRPDPARFSLRERAKYAFLKDLIPALQAGGVLLLLGTDSSAAGMFPGKSAQLELREMVEAGLKPHQALAAGTRNAGRFIRRHVRGAEPFGAVAPGQRADLLLLEADPLTRVDHVSRIAGVAVRGRWLPREELEKMRGEAAASFPR
ncbi:MAG TPA: amidohydrolase family protein [Pyrinomonadaceae bacterium]|nr:amidohydrolase family protein [Pyrinomonadaceae bacterium]